MRATRHTLALASGAVLAVLATIAPLPGCATAPRTTTYTAEDLLEASHQFASALARSDLLATRDASSPPIRLGLGEMVNRSNERLADVDRRATVARVLIAPAMLDTLGRKNASVVLPPPDAAELSRRGVDLASAHASYEPPTHLVGATFRSLTRTASLVAGPADARKDYFLVDMVITEADTRRAVWADTFEFARVARGRLVD